MSSSVPSAPGRLSFRSGRLGVARATRSRHVTPLVAYAALGASALGLYALIDPPFLNPQDTIDPWIYFALFRNFDYTYHTFVTYYYPSRLPWILPGVAANWLLSPLPAFFLLHGLVFLGGGLSAFLLGRRFFGGGTGLVGASALLLSPLFFDANSWDYPDGGTITFLLAAAYFAFSGLDARRRTLRLAWAGFFAAAATGTQLYAAIPVGGLALAYLIAAYAGRPFLVRLLTDLAAVAAGTAALVAACGAVASAHGGPFFFFMPSVREAEAIDLSNWKAPGYAWMLEEPQLLIPLFVSIVAVALLARTRFRNWRRDAQLRYSAATTVFSVYMLIILTVWEFFGGADFFEVSYYFSIFLVPISLVIPSILYLIVRNNRGHLDRVSTLLGLGIVALPVAVLFVVRVGPIERHGFYLVAVLMLIAVLVTFAAAGPSAKPSRALALLGISLVLASTSYASASGAFTVGQFGAPSPFGERRAALSMSVQLMNFVRASGVQRSALPPGFWYDVTTTTTPLNGIQSTYLWGITAIGWHMPHLGTSERQLLDARRPPYLVLLCTSPTCAGARATLRRAGYVNRLRAETVIASGGWRYWVEALRLPEYPLATA